MRDLALHSPMLLCLMTLVVVAVSSLFPASPAEPVLVAVAAVTPPALLLPLAALAAVSHMSTKTIVFLGGGSAQRAIPARHRAAVERACARLSGRPGLQRLAVLVSSVTGLPPFYVVTALCGTLRLPLRDYLIAGTAGRTVRYAGLVFLPQLFAAAS